jgi:hypothetical protein
LSKEGRNGDPASGRAEVFGGDAAQGEVNAVAAFLAPAHTLAALPAYVTRPGAPLQTPATFIVEAGRPTLNRV